MRGPCCRPAAAALRWPTRMRQEPAAARAAAFSSYTPFKADTQELLGFDRELHGKLLQHFAAEAVHYQRHRILVGQPARPGLEQLIVAALGGCLLILVLLFFFYFICF